MIKFKKISKSLAILLIFSLSINTHSAIVSDNDGSAFVTKSEFDNMRNNFADQIDNYTDSIDGKIDGAIAAYLAGLRTTNDYELYLDPNTKYIFPLYLYNGDEWNDPLNTAMFDISVPKTTLMRSKMFVAQGSVGGATSFSRGANVGRINMTTSDKNSATIRWGYYDNDNKFDGQKGQLNIVKRNQNGKKVISSTSNTQYDTFEKEKSVRGQYVLLYKETPSVNTYSDGGPNMNEAYKYNYIDFIGYDTSHLTNSGITFTWAGNKNEGPTWTSKAQVTFRGFGGNTKMHTPNATNLKSSTNMQSVLNYWRGTAGSESGVWGSASNYFGTPKSLVLEQDKEGMDRIFAGTAMMPASIEKNWALTAYSNETANKVVIKKVDSYTANPDNNFAYTFYTGATSMAIYWFQGTRYLVWPQFRAKKNDSNTQQSSDDFSQVRASLVYYQDNRDKTHYMDEGMFLGNMERDGSVKMKIKFVGTGITDLKLAFSKKPFSWNCDPNDMIAFEHRDLSTNKTTKVPVATKSTISPNKEYYIRVDSIKKNDQLYMCWWGTPSTKKLALESLTNFVIEAE